MTAHKLSAIITFYCLSLLLAGKTHGYTTGELFNIGVSCCLSKSILASLLPYAPTNVQAAALVCGCITHTAGACNAAKNWKEGRDCLELPICAQNKIPDTVKSILPFYFLRPEGKGSSGEGDRVIIKQPEYKHIDDHIITRQPQA